MGRRQVGIQLAVGKGAEGEGIRAAARGGVAPGGAPAGGGRALVFSVLLVNGGEAEVVHRIGQGS